MSRARAEQTGSAGLAALPWYDFAELRPWNDLLWQALRADLRSPAGGLRPAVPGSLTRGIDHHLLLDRPELLLSQTCGYLAVGPARAALRIVATPDYGLEGCGPGRYRSLLVVPADHPARELEDLRGSRCVLNEPWSHSGVNAIRPLFAPLARDGRFFSSVRFVGGHLASLDALTRRRADFAAIDAVTVTLLGRHRPKAFEGFRVLGTTAEAFAPPLVCAAAVPEPTVAALRRSLDRVARDPALAELREALSLRGFVTTDFADYEPMLAIERDCRESGYLELFAGS